VAVIKMGTVDLQESDKRELEKRLNQYIREIDRCMAMLNE